MKYTFVFLKTVNLVGGLLLQGSLSLMFMRILAVLLYLIM